MTKAGHGKIARAQNGDFELIDPLDYMLLDKLEANGTMLGGLYPLGTTVTSLKGKFPMLDSNQISSRLRIMNAMGLLAKVQMVGGAGRGAWQRSAIGDAELDKWKEQHGTD